MCGITGYWGGSFAEAAIAERMARRIATRGPDDAGVWSDDAAGLSMAHRRLAILDLSPAGHQPMHSPCNRYVLVYNGEIYNHRELRSELEQAGGAFDWFGHSDTETLLAALRHWGVRGALEKLNGMFAFALWDASERILFLARDRMGEKPLYYGYSGKAFLFGSQLKSLTAHPDWRGRIDRDALALYMRHNYVPTPWSIYQGIFKLPPAHFIAIHDNGRHIGEPICYWDLGRIAERGVMAAAGETDTLLEELDFLLRNSVGRQMAADVPLGAFLSGGYDSTMVVAQMQAQSNRPIKTFSIGFHENSYNEANYAKSVAEYLGTEHTELYVTPDEAMAVIPNLPTIYDEPFSDSSQIPTYLISKLAREHVTVALSGDGGDELFYGYGRYFTCERIWGKLRKIPLPIRRMAAWIAFHSPGAAMERAITILPKQLRIQHFADRLSVLAEILMHPSGQAFYHRLVSHWKNPGSIVLGATEPKTLFDCPGDMPTFSELHEQMMYLDQMTNLPDDILTKVDRASMAVSLETRVPLLDHRLVEFAWRVPSKFKKHDGYGKWLLRQVLYRYVPNELLDRPKMGFGVPIEQWLRGPLRNWAEAMLDEKRLREENFFDPVLIRKIWQEHLSGRRGWHYYLWDVLMFQMWLEKFDNENGSDY